MEIVVNLYANDILRAIDYYVNELNQFKLVSSTHKSATLSFIGNDKIIFYIQYKEENANLLNISLQVSNAENFFKYIESKDLKKCGIIKEAYKFADGDAITFLDAPPGDYFYTIDPFGNKIQFFDKYGERK